MYSGVFSRIQKSLVSRVKQRACWRERRESVRSSVCDRGESVPAERDMRRGGVPLVLLCLLALASACAGARVTPRQRRRDDDIARTAPLCEAPDCLERRRKDPPKFNNGTDKGNLTFEYYRALDTYYFATAAYCTKDNIDAWNSGRKAIVHPNVTDVSAYNTTVPLLWRITDAPVLFFVLYYPQNDTVILSFQGTQGDSVGDWVDDFMFAMGKPPEYWLWPDSDEVDVTIRVEDGFMYAWEELRGRAYNMTIALMEKYTTAKLVVTGHSLGGALASLAAADFSLIGLPIDRVFLFGAPRVGNLGWAWFYNEYLDLRGRTFRVVNERDPVPHIPYTGVTFLRGYHHIGVEVWLQGFNYTQCNDVLPFEMCRFSVTCFYNEDASCSASQSICLTPSCIDMHVGYYDTVSDDKFCKLGC